MKQFEADDCSDLKASWLNLKTVPGSGTVQRG